MLTSQREFADAIPKLGWAMEHWEINGVGTANMALLVSIWLARSKVKNILPT